MENTAVSAAVQGPGRVRLKAQDVTAFQASLVVDDRRRRPLYFDGRFLAARDLVREQNYFLTRQADLGRAGGFGVVEGLYVQRGGAPTQLSIGAGHGVTPAGELVTIPRDVTLDLVDVPEIQRLNAAFGLLRVPNDPPRNRTGLFVVALRPVEFSANPVASYPTSITGTRSAEDGEIVEGAVVTLIPYADEGPNVSPSLRRSRVAHEVFVTGTGKGAAAGALPLAMVSLNRGTVEWLDPFLVRREVGADQGDVVGLGFAPRGLREAHLLQYEAQLREVLALRGSLGYRFAAADYFMALPPAGRLPAACVDAADFTQIFFPPTVDVDLSLVPEDEIPALVEESMTLPPLDLTRTADELDSTSIVICIPVPREQLRTISTRVQGLVRSLRPAAPGMVARRSPLEHLRGVRLPGNFVPMPEPGDSEDAAWRGLLQMGGMLWYIRRKTLHVRADLAGEREVFKAMQPATTDAQALNKRQADLDAKDVTLRTRENDVTAREAAAALREQQLAGSDADRQAKLRERLAELEKRELDLNRREQDRKRLEDEITQRDARSKELQAVANQRDSDVRGRLAELLAKETEVRKREETVAGREITAGRRETDAGNKESLIRQREDAVARTEALQRSRISELDQRQARLDQADRDILSRRSELERRETTITSREAAVARAESIRERYPYKFEAP
ncbi:hypothetical protein [Longimicrobium sp.]|uniref:hypothetical protein n=1 Tax=Longimicrobium sp. TaxID=2029185 RepID=UPI002E3191FB|nr:hypothetical protein [Longimicrobium sp.]HEX6042055.1 hypothetical protein [Longimicrobium sp.]